MLEVQSPACSPEGVIAAVQNGADAVYLGFNDFGAPEAAKGFTNNEFERALEYCRIRGVKTYLMMNALAYDHELPQIAKRAIDVCRLGIDAIIVQDFGVMMAIRQAVAGIPLHASAKMSIHNLEGAKMAAAMGFKRVFAARELSRRKLSYICRNAPIEIAVFVHGALCMCYSGQCYMSAVVSRHSDSRCACAQPCHLSYGAGGHSAGYPLSMKSNCLARYIADLESIGVKSIVIEGLAKRPEYSAIVTGIYSKAAHDGKTITTDDLRTLQKTFARHGLTDGFYTNRLSQDMTGAPDVEDKADSVIFSTARKNYLNGELQRVPVRFSGKVRDGKRIKLSALDDRENTAVVYGPVPSPAFHTELTVASLQTQLHKTGGTPFYCAGVKATVDPGLALPPSVFNPMQRKLLAEILECRKPATALAEGEYVPGEHVGGNDSPPILTASVLSIDQLSKEMENLCPAIVYIPVMELEHESTILRGFLENEAISVSVALPRIIHDSERKKVSEKLDRALELGITEALVGNIGHIQFARNHGMVVRGDYGLNVFNSESLNALRNLGLKSATLSFELRFPEIREMSKPIETELIVYGRLPLMITENCIVKNTTGACTCENFTGLVDNQSAVYPIVPEFGCRNVLLSSRKLFLADKRRTLASLGLWAKRLSFTTENALECAAVMKRYMGLGDYEPTGYMRGLYYSGAKQEIKSKR